MKRVTLVITWTVSQVELKFLIEGITDITADLIGIVIPVLVIEAMVIETMAISSNDHITMANAILGADIDTNIHSITIIYNDITYL